MNFYCRSAKLLMADLRADLVNFQEYITYWQSFSLLYLNTSNAYYTVGKMLVNCEKDV